MTYNIFGSKDALIGPVALLVGAAMFLGGAVLRKALNDSMGIKFSVVGCTALGNLTYIVLSNLLEMKWALLISLVGFAVGGFLFSFIAGESSGNEGEESDGGNYEE
jgi:hypothetical protein